MSKVDDSLPERIIKPINEREKIRKVTDAVRYHKAQGELNKIIEKKQLAKDIDNIDFSTDFDQLSDDARVDAEHRKHAITFMYPEISDFIQMASGSLCLVCAATGTGKSTLSANIAYTLMEEGKRVLVIANEEKATDVAARISCLMLGVNIHKYKNKDGVPDAVRDMVLDNIKTFNHRLSIVALDYQDNPNIVTSPEGMSKLLAKASGVFDTVIIDYYQNVHTSMENPGMKPYEAQEIFSNSLDHFKNAIGCPIILLAQIRRGDEDYKVRLEGRRVILNKCTDIFEIKVDKPNSRSALICHKDRWLGNQGEEVLIGYDGGKFVPYNKSFEDKIRSTKVQVIEDEAKDE